MTRGDDGVWSVDFSASPQGFLGYFVFDFEDGQHHVDRNGGAYWDVMACYRGEPADFVASTKAQTYLGREIAPGMRRRPDIPRAIAYLRRDYEENPVHDNDVFWIWNDELLKDGDTPATFALIGHEIEDTIAKKPGDFHLFLQTIGFVGPTCSSCHRRPSPPTGLPR